MPTTPTPAATNRRSPIAITTAGRQSLPEVSELRGDTHHFPTRHHQLRPEPFLLQQFLQDVPCVGRPLASTSQPPVDTDEVPLVSLETVG
ncbi:hypothetical protein L3X38_034517 [Prunus dulcis]|uniref:Uncharacterized protein n=1 Tax=Prunus dulcis TaxID=3755 RepID=A0AAD4VI86_PRUDU|nr:hypothetical protein L3X38_034517 [Prunus dulcis]